MSTTQMPRNILHKVLLLTRRPAQNHPQPVRLDKVLIRNGDLLRNSGTSPLFVFLACFDGLVRQWTEGGWVVRVCAVVAMHVHCAIAVPGAEGSKRAVDGDLVVVPAQTVAVRVWVGEETGLQDWVGGGLDAWDHV